MREAPPLRLARAPLPPLLSRDSGPGLRWLLFTQGCARPCTTRCLSPHLLPSEGGELVSTESLCLAAGLVAAGRWGEVEGLTLLGGEPTDQAEALLPLVQRVQELGLSVMLYSGRTRASLEADPLGARLLGYCDLLVDGPFLPERHDPDLRWRGSSNQRIHRLGERYACSDLEADQSRRGLTLHITPGQPVAMNGLQSRPAASAVEAAWRLGERGRA